MNKKHRLLMRNLTEAKPSVPPELENWAESEKGKRVLAEILATEVAPEKAGKARRSWLTNGFAWGALALVIIGVGAFLAVHFLTESGENQVVSRPTTTSSVTTSAKSVTVEQALSQIIALVRATPSIAQGEQGPEQKSLVEEARAWGLLSPSEAASIKLDQAITRKQFALWLWRCFGRFLPQGTETVTVSDLAGLTPEEQQAVVGLVRDGVVQLPDNGVFGGNELLTPAEASDLLARVKARLQ